MVMSMEVTLAAVRLPRASQFLTDLVTCFATHGGEHGLGCPSLTRRQLLALISSNTGLAAAPCSEATCGRRGHRGGLAHRKSCDHPRTTFALGLALGPGALLALV
jgi:hypothetical protein